MNAAGIKWLDGRDVTAAHKSFQRNYGISDVNITINPKHCLKLFNRALTEGVIPIAAA